MNNDVQTSRSRRGGRRERQPRRAPLHATTEIGTGPQGPPRERLHHYFEASCDRNRLATAVEIEGDPTTYGELEARANQLAHHLRQRGIGPGQRVAILLPRSLDTYVTLLGVLKAGGAFVPIDPSSPPDRIAYISDDAQVDLMITTTAFAEVATVVQCPILTLDDVRAELAAHPTDRPVSVLEGDPTAYIIYTSGSSGRPKGVEVAQSSICNFINVVPPLYRVQAGDRVYQGMTIAFDFSIEEIWPTWAVGATIVAGPNDGRRLGSELGEFLHEHRVTVLYCVPTVLATIDRDLPLIHTLNVGGEACPAELVQRWRTGDRVMLNTYGPTEATVTCIMATLEPDQPVTIGYPLPTYEAYLLDDDLQPVPEGEVGEICIGGPGVAKGYVGRPDLTADKFRPNPFAGGGRLYRTGDLGRWTEHGIEYKGRADAEVKVRGHRIDLGEIESVLRLDESVLDAVATVTAETKELAAFITTVPSAPVEGLLERLHAQLRETVPPYMVPAYLSTLDTFPMLASGKVDRKSLPEPQGARLVTTTGPHREPSTSTEKELCQVWGEVLNLDPSDVSIDADFFVELGGHSLAAATVVSTLRRRGFAHLAIRDLYDNPTVAGLAEVADAHDAVTFDAGSDDAAADAEPARRRRGVRRAGLAQLAMLYAVLLLVSLPVSLVYEANDGDASLRMGLQLLALVPVSYIGGRWVLPVAGIRLLSIALRPGTYRLWGSTHLRVWAIQKLVGFAPLTVLSGSPFLAPYLRLLGARVGADSHLATGEVGLPRFLRIGDRVSVGHGAQLHTTLIEGDTLLIGPVTLGDDTFVGASAMVLPDSELGSASALGEHSVLGPAQAIPAHQRWIGSPAAIAAEPDPLLDLMAAAAPARRGWSRWLKAGFALGVVVVELLPLVATLPVVLPIWWALLQLGLWPSLALTALSGPIYVLSVCLSIAGLKRLVLARTPTGILPAESALGLRKWFVDKLLELSLLLTNSLYATLYTVPWLRMLGARIGAGSEVSTVASVSPDLLVVEEQSFIADMAQIGSATHHAGLMALDTTHVGRRAFVGNASFIPAGTKLGSGSLVGVHTVPPRASVPPDTSWLGSPAIYLPRRQESQSFSDDLTFRPGRAKVAQRLAIEFVRITLPASILATAMYLALLIIATVADENPGETVVFTTPLVWLGSGLAIVVLLAAVKWALVGAYRPRVEPLWSTFVRRSELVTGLYEAAAVPVLLQSLTGTPLLGPLLRLYGAKVGARTLIDTTYLTEFDLVHIGDDAVIGTGASMQTHLFEDRVMKMSTLTVEAGASVGPRSVVLYDAVVGRDGVVGPLSLVMKGESLMPATRWAGIPAEFDRTTQRRVPVRHEAGAS